MGYDRFDCMSNYLPFIPSLTAKCKTIENFGIRGVCAFVYINNLNMEEGNAPLSPYRALLLQFLLLLVHCP